MLARMMRSLQRTGGDFRQFLTKTPKRAATGQVSNDNFGAFALLVILGALDHVPQAIVGPGLTACFPHIRPETSSERRSAPAKAEQNQRGIAGTGEAGGHRTVSPSGPLSS